MENWRFADFYLFSLLSTLISPTRVCFTTRDILIPLYTHCYGRIIYTNRLPGSYAQIPSSCLRAPEHIGEGNEYTRIDAKYTDGVFDFEFFLDWEIYQALQEAWLDWLYHLLFQQFCFP